MLKQLLTANVRPDTKFIFKEMENLIKAQIDNSLDLGWSPENIILVTNIPYTFRGVKALVTNLNGFCFTGSKMFALKWLMDGRVDEGDVIWSHDLDAWQNVQFECPSFADVGACEYSRPKFQGGSIFWRCGASKDIVDEVVKIIVEERSQKEEPVIDRVFKSQQFSSRVTVNNPTFNVGCSGYYERWLKAEKPLKVCHFHPSNRIAVQTHVLDRNGIGERGVSGRLEKILRKYWASMQTELDEEGKQAQVKKIADRKSKGISST